MLTRLIIRHFAIIEYADIQLKPGFTVFSGETGSGKSMLIKAITFGLGGKIDTKKIRLRDKKCTEVSLTALSTPHISQILKKIGIPYIDQEQKYISICRLIETNGRTRTFINGCNSSSAQLQEITANLVAVHEQNAHMLLAEQKRQRELLDQYGELEPLVDEVKKNWEIFQTKKNKYEELKKKQYNSIKKEENLLWKINQINTLNPSKEEWYSINQEYSQLKHIFNLINEINTIYSALDDSEDSLIKHFKQISGQISMLVNLDEDLLPVKNIFSDIGIHLKDASKMLLRYLQQKEINPIRLQHLEERINSWIKLARQLEIQPEKIYESLNEYQKQLDDYVEDAKIESLINEVKKAKTNYEISSNKLSQRREISAKNLKKEVNSLLHSLSMNTADFEIKLNLLKEGSIHGNEEIKFNIATHKGINPFDLIKISSGGELSRIGLALTVATKKANQTPTLIFDEVDSGVGGGVAEILGNMLSNLGREQQILCITHLAQVASKSHVHYCINKSFDKNGNAVTNIRELVSNEEKIKEIARMSTGIKITKAALQHAKEMFFNEKNI